MIRNYKENLKKTEEEGIKKNTRLKRNDNEF